MLFQIVDIGSARSRGLKKYFTGEPCKRGHISERYTKKRACVLCVRENSLSRSRTQKVKDQNKAYKKTDAYKKRAKEYKQLEHVKSAAREYARRAWIESESYRESKRRSAKKHIEKRRAQSREYYKNRKEYFRAKLREFAENNPGYFVAKNSRRRRGIAERTPPWFSEFDELVISEAYRLAKEREKATGIKWHVDHMVPLFAEKACGLHCAKNLQVIPQTINNSKGNKMIYMEPMEWLEAAKHDV